MRIAVGCFIAGFVIGSAIGLLLACLLQVAGSGESEVMDVREENDEEG